VNRDLGDRCLRPVLALCDLLEHRGFLEPQPDPQAEGDQGGGQQERDAPAPGVERGVGEHPVQQGDHAVGQQGARGWADLRGGRPEAAAFRVAVLAGEQDGAAPLTADRDALGEAQQHEQDRGAATDGGVRGQQADQERGDAGQQQCVDEDFLAPDDVTEPAEHEPAERTGEVADGVGGEGGHGAGEVVAGGEEQVAEQRRGGHRVGGEVVVLQ
jgi:hypothetical protein